jgi:nicotinate-nucleotide pyrophosphorylase (carboxylating)
VLCGSAWFAETFRQLDSEVQVRWNLDDGAHIAPNTVLCELSGPARAILTGERTALNFLQLLSATATVTARFAKALAGTATRILDTRKTIPGLRSAQKYAVRCGGGENHRMGLYDRVLIKENHIAACGSIAAAVAAARASAPGILVEVETEDLAEVASALAAQCDIILIDEFSLEDMQRAVALNRAAARPAKIEASGSVSLERLADIAATGVDYISSGGLTKHVQAIDMSLRIL